MVEPLRDNRSTNSMQPEQYLRLTTELRTWMICEQGERWITAARRFAPQIMHPLVPALQMVEVADLRNHLQPLGEQPAIVLCEVDRQELLQACDNLAQIKLLAPQALVLLAVAELSGRERSVLGEFGYSALVRHPEDLPVLTGLIRRYFEISSSKISGP